MVAKLFRTLRVDAIVEPTLLFTYAVDDASLRNPTGLGRQVTIDVAVTGVDGQSRASDEAAERPLQAHYNQKIAKYGCRAKRFAVYSCGLLSRWSNSWRL